jgi:hypothetical protein
MAVMTEFEIKRFSGQDKTILPAGTIVTPAAKDWASEHHLEIVYDNSPTKESSMVTLGGNDRKAILKRVIEIIVTEKRKTGAPIKNEEISELVIACLKRLGCQI